MSTTDRDALVKWYGRLVAAYDAMTDAERDELHVWEREHLDGETGTSEWP